MTTTNNGNRINWEIKTLNFETEVHIKYVIIVNFIYGPSLGVTESLLVMRSAVGVTGASSRIYQSGCFAGNWQFGFD